MAKKKTDIEIKSKEKRTDVFVYRERWFDYNNTVDIR